MKKSKNNPKWFKNDSIFVQLVTSYTALYLLFFWGIFFIYFLSPEGDPLNKGADGKGSWNLWTGLFLWLLSGVLLFFKKKYSYVDFDNDPELKKIDRDIQDTKDPELKKSKLEERIENDPVLKKIDKEIQNTIDSQVPYLLKIKKEKPEDWAWMVKAGLVPKDLKGDDEDSSHGEKKDSQKPEGRE